MMTETEKDQGAWRARNTDGKLIFLFFTKQLIPLIIKSDLDFRVVLKTKDRW